MEPLLTPESLSALLTIPKNTLAEWRYQGKGPVSIRVGRHVRYRSKDVETWIEQQSSRKGVA